jgi:AraC family transcriptional regulator, regulatory protein of adaptative response / methylated-DNA-[protein]-cysteine methyltransferase
VSLKHYQEYVIANSRFLSLDAPTSCGSVATRNFPSLSASSGVCWIGCGANLGMEVIFIGGIGMATMAISKAIRGVGPVLGVWSRAWEMVEERNVAGDALFVYAVKTTGIFCRPSCPSRRPLRESVEFFATSELARAAGYRACKRCQPGEEHPQQKLVGLACEYIERNLETTITLDVLGKVMALSPFHAQRVFRRTLGVTPKQYQQARRMERFRGELTNGSRASVTDAIYESGFSSGSGVYENSAAEMGMTPTEFRKNARGVKISFGIAESPLGKVLVAVTGAGVCAVAFGDLESELEDDLRGRFALAEIRRDDAGLGEMLRQVVARLSEHPLAAELPLDVRATAFQRRVWTALQAIPRGETRSYAQVAAEIGQPTAVRAVARACASNPVAVVIPCHRVVGSDGKLTGYRWGVERKRRLLELERAAFVSV